MEMLGTILLIVLVLMLVGALPAWPHSSGWGYYPSGGMGLVLPIVGVLPLMGRVRQRRGLRKGVPGTPLRRGMVRQP